MAFCVCLWVRCLKCHEDFMFFMVARLCEVAGDRKWCVLSYKTWSCALTYSVYKRKLVVILKDVCSDTLGLGVLKCGFSRRLQEYAVCGSGNAPPLPGRKKNNNRRYSDKVYRRIFEPGQTRVSGWFRARVGLGYGLEWLLQDAPSEINGLRMV